MARHDSEKLVKPPSPRSRVRQSIDGSSAEKIPNIRRERVKRLSGEIHWRDTHARQAGQARVAWFIWLAGLSGFFRSSNQTNKTNQMNKTAAPGRPANCLSTLLEDGTALSLRAKPLPLHLLNEGRAVHMEQLSRFARNPVGLAKRADDETVLELLDLS